MPPRAAPRGRGNRGGRGAHGARGQQGENVNRMGTRAQNCARMEPVDDEGSHHGANLGFEAEAEVPMAPLQPAVAVNDLVAAFAAALNQPRVNMGV
jgi:hypothetical protein